MVFKRLLNNSDENFNLSYSLYLSAFPYNERRGETEHLNVMSDSDYHSLAIIENEKFIGILMYWESFDFIYVEHFATIPEVRGQGKGALVLDRLKKKGKTIILEIEPPVDLITERRYGFYKRNGFIMNDFNHTQARYRISSEKVNLKILSYPKKLSADEYSEFNDYLTRNVAIKIPD